MKRPAAFTTLEKYSKMKGVSKLVTGKTPLKKDTDSCFSEILEQTLDSVFCMDEPTPCKSAKKLAMRTPRSTVESDDSGQEELEQTLKKARTPVSTKLPLKRSAEPIANNIELGATKMPVAREVALAAARKKELKLLSKEALQELAESKELEMGKKDDMIEAVLAHEAKARADLRAREGQAKQVVA